MKVRQLFPSGRPRDKLRKCGGQGQTHLENMQEVIKEWLETAQINQQENDVVSKGTISPSPYSSGSSGSKSRGGSAAHFFKTNSKIHEEWEGSDDEEEDFE